MPKYEKLTRENMPKHLDDSAEDHNGHGWDSLEKMLSVSQGLNIKLRPADIVAVFGVDRKTARGWLDVLEAKR